MSNTLTIDVFDKGATEAVRALEQELSPKQLQKTYGPRCRELTRDHLKANPRNKRGWPSTNFWEQASRATRYEPRGNDTIAITVNWIGVRQRFLGGPIGPVNAGALAIPISPLSYGKSPKNFPGSFILRTKKGAYIVMYGNADGKPVRPEAGRKRARAAMRGTLIFLFKLSGGVNQAADPTVMPTMAEYRATVFAAARERLAGIQQRKGVKA